VKKISLLFLTVLVLLVPAHGYVNDALSIAHEAAIPYVKKGFSVREDAWGGDLGVKDQQAVTAQLFKGNEYWFCLGTEVKGAVVTLHIYDSQGKLAESESWQKGRFAAARIAPTKTGSYYAIITVDKSPQERTGWAVVYAYK
jgi:predicted carbohydrate-binding protein with CBM5 and CBM33 domain